MQEEKKKFVKKLQTLFTLYRYTWKDYHYETRLLRTPW